MKFNPLLSILLLLVGVLLPACEDDATTPGNDDPTVYAYRLNRATLFEETFNNSATVQFEPGSGSSVVIIANAIRLGQTAHGYDYAYSDLDIPSSSDYEVELVMTQVAGNSFGFAWGDEIGSDLIGEEIVIQQNPGIVQVYADRVGAAPDPPTLEASFPTIANGSQIKFTYRRLGSNFYLFINERFIGQRSATAVGASFVNLNTQGVDAVDVSVDNVRVSTLTR